MDVMVELTKLVDEMKVLRKGRGIYVSQIDARVGPHLREVCEVTETDSPSEIRRKVARRLEVLSAGLPEDLRFVVQAAFAIRPDARMPLYKDRVCWAAVRLNRDPRTARRRVDDGIHQLAQLAAITPNEPTAPAWLLSSGTRPSWHTSHPKVIVALDRARPEVLEARTVVAEQDGLTELDLAVTVADLPSADLDIDVFYGGTVTERVMESSERLAFRLKLPKPLDKGESHEFVLRFRFPDGYPMRPHFACVPRRPCALFDLRVRFDRRNLPSTVWSVRSVFQRDAGDPVTGGEPLEINEAGEVRTTFETLFPGLAYGAGWAY